MTADTELEHLNEEIVPVIDWRMLERQTRSLLADWRTLLTRHPSDARPLLRELLTEPLQVTPILEPTRRGFRVDGAIGKTCGNGIGVPGQNFQSRPAAFFKDSVILPA
jgi:hypothetical protein